MTKLVLPAAFLAAFITAPTISALAQTTEPAPYCLEEADGGGELLCRFQTMQQCIAAKTGETDECVPNPAAANR